MSDTKLNNSNGSFTGDRSMETNACLCQSFTSAEIIVIKVCYSFLGSVGLIENIGVILVILFKRVMLDVPSNWFVLSMAIADAVTCLAAIFLVFIIDVKNGSTTLIVFAFIVQFAMLSSTGNLSLLTFNRFLSVYSSLRYPAFMTISRAKCLVWLPWIAAVLILAVVGYSYQGGFYNGTYIANAYYTVLITMISVANVYMFKQARDKRKIDLRNAVLSSKGKLLKREYRLLIRLLIVNLTFFGSCIPMMMMLYLHHTKESRQTSSFRHKIVWFYLVSVLNAVIDPLVYSISHPIFKSYFNEFQNMLYSKPQ